MCLDQPKAQLPYLLFATPRTGSWAQYVLFSYYLKKMGSPQTRDLGEVFNVTSHSIWREDGEVIDRGFRYPITTAELSRSNGNQGTKDLVLEIIRKRGLLLNPDPQKYFFKVFPFDLYHEETTNWLLESYQWIFLERRNLWEQLLSYLIARHTDCWGEKSRTSIPAQVPSTRMDFEFFQKMIWRYHDLKVQIKPKHVFVYEDFCRQSPQDFLLQSGFKDVPNIFSGLKVTEKQKYSSKEGAFSDIDAIKDWYRSSFLNKLSPLASNHDRALSPIKNG